MDSVWHSPVSKVTPCHQILTSAFPASGWGSIACSGVCCGGQNTIQLLGYRLVGPRLETISTVFRG